MGRPNRVYGADGCQSGAQPEQRTQPYGSPLGTAHAGATVGQNRIPTTPLSGVSSREWKLVRAAVSGEHLALWVTAWE